MYTVEQAASDTLVNGLTIVLTSGGCDPHITALCCRNSFMYDT
jgi:hypothetical protein